MAESQQRRKQGFQNIPWFSDLKQRKFLNLDPPYQRRSVWNRQFQESFIDTILLGFPSPAIFLYREIQEQGRTKYDVVDGKQRLTAVFEFIEDVFPVSEKSPIERLRGKYFSALHKDDKLSFWDYDFTVEYLPTNNVTVVDDIFQRLNKNTARLTRQELRHAKYNGDFIKTAENLATWTWGGINNVDEVEPKRLFDDVMKPKLPSDLPKFTSQSRRQMKDIELVGTLLLLLEEGVRSYSADALDEAFNTREDWEKKTITEDRYRQVVNAVARMHKNRLGRFIRTSRLRNQADFYSLFGAVAELLTEKKFPAIAEVLPRIEAFVTLVNDFEAGSDSGNRTVAKYHEAARSASNDAGPRTDRITIMKDVMCGIFSPVVK